MLHATTRDRSPLRPPYQRHRLEQILLYQIVEQHYPVFGLDRLIGKVLRLFFLTRSWREQKEVFWGMLVDKDP
jgi:hypothetical protein